MKFFKLLFVFVVLLFVVSPVFGQSDPIPDDWPDPCAINPQWCEEKGDPCPSDCPPPVVCVGGPSDCQETIERVGDGDGVGVVFYCSQPGTPTGLNLKHVCLTDFQTEYSLEGYNYCLYGTAYNHSSGCPYYNDPCRIEHFGATAGICRGEKWEDINVGGCELNADHSGCVHDFIAPCIRCVYQPPRTVSATATYEKGAAPDVTEAGITILSNSNDCESVVANNPANQAVSASPHRASSRGGMPLQGVFLPQQSLNCW